MAALALGLERTNIGESLLSNPTLYINISSIKYDV
jgi:hypothetical protein